MADVVYLAHVRSERQRQLREVLITALSAVLDLMKDLEEEPGEPVTKLGYPIDEEACMKLIIGNVVLLRPSLATSKADRRAMLPMLAEVKRTFAISKSSANDGKSAEPKGCARPLHRQ